MSTRSDDHPARPRAASESMMQAVPLICTTHNYILEYSLIAEYNLLQNHPVPGVYVIPSQNCCTTWNGVIFIRNGIYQGGAYRFTLDISNEFPDSVAPRVTFFPPVFHPMMDSESGQFDVNQGFQTWRRNTNHIYHILLFLRRSFYKISVEQPLNPHAAVLYENDLELFKDKVERNMAKCRIALYSEQPSGQDPHRPEFAPWDSEIHEEARKKLFRHVSPEGASYNAQVSGLSWVKPGTTELFSI